MANDGTILYATGNNQYQLTWFGADATAMRTVGAPGQYIGVLLSRDGTEALTFLGNTVGNRDIWY